MSFSKDVETKDGTMKHVVAGTEEDLKEAVKTAKGESAPVYPNINKPVQKGHDLVRVDGDDMSKVRVDGTGAHNSPMDAIQPDGKPAGAWDGSEEPDYKSVPNTSENDPTSGQPVMHDLPPKARDEKGAKDETTADKKAEK